MAAPAYRASGAATLGNTTTSVTINLPAGTASGDILDAIIANGGANAAPSSVPSGWTLVDSAGNTPSDVFWGGLYRLVAGGSEPSTYTWSGMTDSCTGCIIAISGADTTTPEQVHAVRFNASGTVGTAGVTTTGADTLVVSGYAEDDNNAVTSNSWTCATDPATLTQRIEQTSSGGNDTATAFATGTKATAGATGSTSFTLSASRQNVSFTFAVQAATGGSISVGQASETDTANAITPSLQVAVGQATSTDTAQAVTPSLSVAVGQAAETDTANAITPSHQAAVAQAESTETAQAITPSHSVAVAQATSTDTAGAITPSIVVNIGQAEEADTAGTVSAGSPITVAVGQAVETGTAVAVTAGHLVALAQADEQDTANGITPSLSVAVGQAAETSTAGSITPSHLVAVGQAEELDTAGAATPSKRVAVEQATETDTASAIDSGQTTEQDITLNVGPPATAWATGRPERGWAAGVTTSWSAGSPTV